ncbi:MAG TPA: polynucleotide adenylyltransferase PcnB [Polyangiales bacterium]|nr:polynucleotide adenylyltransferase PcnB [Polyangiales bacterium]
MEGTPSIPAPEVYHGQISAERIDPDAVKVLKRLTRHGHTAYLVGGGVRDLLLGRAPKDFDIATSARPSEVRRLFRNCRIIGRRFRLAHILFAGGKIIEVATFRRDPRDSRDESEEVEEVDGDGSVSLLPSRGEEADLLIRQDNTFGDPHEDAIRRDFTINGLFYDLERDEVIDYVGGVIDLRAGVVRTIGAPDVRFREDPIRVLRAIKFSARLDLGIAPDVYDAMVDLREELSRSAPPRVFEEILRLLRGGAAQRSIYLLWDVGALGVVLPELSAHIEDQARDADLLWGRLAALDAMKAEGRLPSDTVLIAALLYGPLEEAVLGADNPSEAFEEFFQEINVRLSVPRRMRDRVRLIFAAQRRLARGQRSGLRGREFYGDATDLYELRMHSEGKPMPHGWRDAETQRPVSPESKPAPMGLEERPARRRRRPRRRPQG